MKESWINRTADRAAQAAAEQRKRTQIRVSRHIPGAGYLDENNVWQTGYAVTIYEGDGFIRAQPVTHRVHREDTSFIVEEPTVEVDGQAPRFEVGDTVTVTASRNAQLVGSEWIVRGTPGDSYGVQAKYPVERVVAMNEEPEAGGS